MKSLARIVLLVGGLAAQMAHATATRWQVQLLDGAYAAVSAMPLDPHIKNRSREQYKLAEAALKLDLPAVAERYGEGIAYWQQGAVLAELALYHVEHGETSQGREYLARAERWMDGHRASFTPESGEQRWRLSRVASRIALVHTALDEPGKVAEISSFVGKDEAPRLLEYKLSKTPEDELGQSIELLESLAGSGEYESVKGALDGLATLYGRFYAKPGQRDAIEHVFESILPKVPWLSQIDLIVRQGKAAVAHGDPENALAKAVRARNMLDQHPCAPRFFIPAAARIAALRAVAGDPRTALAQLDGCMERFEQEYRKTVDIDRAGMLCPVAEAYLAAGAPEQTEALYLRAIAEGQVNPNSRPRATDLSLICRSLVRQQQKPARAVFQALEEMKSKLGDPW